MSTTSTVPDFLAEEEYEEVPQTPSEERPFNPILDVDEDQEDELNAPPSSSAKPTDAVRTAEIEEEASETSTIVSTSKYGRGDLRGRDQLAMAFLRKFSLVSSKADGDRSRSEKTERSQADARSERAWDGELRATPRNVPTLVSHAEGASLPELQGAPR